ncbi:hypothetical protein J3459_019422 [Metarhizium acridum]|nr:hypothetical protein J3459_019422 [Metarhizium acridum]
MAPIPAFEKAASPLEPFHCSTTRPSVPKMKLFLLAYHLAEQYTAGYIYVCTLLRVLLCGGFEQLRAHVMRASSASSPRLVALDFEAAETAGAESPSPAATLALTGGGQVVTEGASGSDTSPCCSMFLLYLLA